MKVRLHARRLVRFSSLAEIPKTATATPHLYSREVFRLNGPMYVDPLLDRGLALYWRLNADGSISQTSGEDWLNAGAERERALRDGEPDPWRVAIDELGGPCYVSTVFIGINATGSREAPLVFETMARIGPRGEDEVTRKYSTFGAALAGHAELVDEHRRGGDAGRG